MRKSKMFQLICFLSVIIISLCNVTSAIIKGNVCLAIINIVIYICALGGCLFTLRK
ncbi:hypothetical protein OUHCRE1_47900 [Enterobacter asburiae]